MNTTISTRTYTHQKRTIIINNTDNDKATMTTTAAMTTTITPVCTETSVKAGT